MDDNPRSHRESGIQDLLQNERIDRMVWPAYSSDLNPIKHAWEYLGRRIAARNPPPCSTNDLIRMLKKEWRNIP